MPLSPTIRRFIELEKKKTDVRRYFDDLKEATKNVVEEIGVGGHFQDEEGTVYQVVIPDGRFVQFDHVGYVRTRRSGETRGDLSITKARELGYEVE
jgi:hypothetical protein